MMELTEHARIRCAQRRVDADSFEFIKKHGRKIRRTGVTFFFLGKRDIPKKLRHQDQFAKLEGSVLLVGSDGVLITAFRNKQALKTILKKPKHRLPSFQSKHNPLRNCIGYL